MVAGRTWSRTLVNQTAGVGCFDTAVPYLFAAHRNGTILWEYFFSQLSTTNSSDTSAFSVSQAGDHWFEKILYIAYPRNSVVTSTDDDIIGTNFVVYLKSLDTSTAKSNGVVVAD